MDPEYVSGGGAAKNIEEKVVAVFDREFALALQQVDVKDQDQLVLGFCLICVNLSRKRRSWQLSTKESLKSAGQSVKIVWKKHLLAIVNYAEKLNWYIH